MDIGKERPPLVVPDPLPEEAPAESSPTPTPAPVQPERVPA